MAIFWSRVAAGQQVAGDLLDGELVVGKVAVQGVDDPVAIPPDGAERIGAVAGRIGVACQVQPHPRPALAEGRVVQKPVHRPLIGTRRLVGEELRRQLTGRRRQAAQVQADPTQQGVRVGLGRGMQSFLLQAGENPVIQTVPRPGGIH